MASDELQELGSTTHFLENISDASDLRAMRKRDLNGLCTEIRQCIIDTVSKTSGHFASGLGVVELTVALHYVYDTPDDVIIWDVGHQAYPHKILTGSKDRLHTIRHKDGLHAFIKRGETAYDHLSTGHASTSIGSAIGMAVANRNLGRKTKVVAVIGDGALSGGCAFEALNHAAEIEGIDLTVILNDNEMSISENVGTLSQGLSHLLSSQPYAKFVESGKKVLEIVPAVRDFALRAQEHAKGMLLPGTLFEEFGFNYIGPVDGHDLRRLIPILQNVKELGGLQFLHVLTTKGKGYAKAEEDPITYHGVPTFDPSKGIDTTVKKVDKSFSAVFGRWICDAAEKDSKITAITPAMRIGSALEEFAQRYPKNFFDVAIAEQHAVVFASGLAAGGMRPVVAIYSSFLQRAYDGVIHDIAIQNLPIMLAIDRAGLVGPDGATHQGAFDIGFLKIIPNFTIFCPSDAKELYMALNTAYGINGPTAVRYPRTNATGSLEGISLEDRIEIGRGRVLHQGSDVCVLAFGSLSVDYLTMCQEQGYTLCDMRFIKPLDTDLVLDMARSHRLVITAEDGCIEGGVGQDVSKIIFDDKCDCKVVNLGLPDKFIDEGTRGELLEFVGLDALSVYKRAQKELM
ncbi:1-deoxy-D-xylulose-5-phosphate synthase [Anaerobiospirillum thomasii]|uniref:1-deoxy-D-xylulose-5-phosphate synthase n=1 Tax=Anaerobiospirillum thomasii TaxID=179995 RepID=UPI000D8E7CD4|nr:1-deoxy-D-xylulose-5-phosphate synthase [Anaerobiospirillum thomasii]SPT71871.1 1-deoxy-D-xylulose-5-phosphate synthase [Anaerobiospirillum thomasii]